jgi:hypothetical protein
MHRLKKSTLEAEEGRVKMADGVCHNASKGKKLSKCFQNARICINSTRFFAGEQI